MEFNGSEWAYKTTPDVVTPVYTKAITIPAPENGDNFAMWIVDANITIQSIQGITSEGTVDIDVAGNTATISDTVTNVSVSTSGIATGTVVSISLSNISGVTGYVNVTVNYTRD